MLNDVEQLVLAKAARLGEFAGERLKACDWTNDYITRDDVAEVTLAVEEILLHLPVAALVAGERLATLEAREALLADYAAVMGEVDAANSRKPFDAFAAGKLAARHADVLVKLREAGEKVWEERRSG